MQYDAARQAAERSDESIVRATIHRHGTRASHRSRRRGTSDIRHVGMSAAQIYSRRSQCKCPYALPSLGYDRRRYQTRHDGDAVVCVRQIWPRTQAQNEERSAAAGHFDVGPLSLCFCVGPFAHCERSSHKKLSEAEKSQQSRRGRGSQRLREKVARSA